MTVIEKALDTKLNFPVPDKLIGDEAAFSRVVDAVRSSRMSRSIMICGPQGSGRKSLAYRLGASFAAQGQFSEDFLEDFAKIPQSVQHSIRLLRQGAHPDILVIQSEGKKGEVLVKAARQLQGFQATTAAFLKAKVVIVNDADALSEGSSNAILKVLEEPKKTLAVILVASQPRAVMPTILSRCVRFMLPKLSHENLKRILEVKGATLPSEHLALCCGDSSLGLHLASSDFDESVFSNVLAYLFDDDSVPLSPEIVQKLSGQEKAIGKKNVLRVLLEAVRTRLISTKKIRSVSANNATGLAQFEQRMLQRSTLSLDSTASWMDALGCLRAMLAR